MWLLSQGAGSGLLLQWQKQMCCNTTFTLAAALVKRVNCSCLRSYHARSSIAKRKTASGFLCETWYDPSESVKRRAWLHQLINDFCALLVQKSARVGSNFAMVPIPQELVGRLIGHRGSNLNQLRVSTGCHTDPLLLMALHACILGESVLHACPPPFPTNSSAAKSAPARVLQIPVHLLKLSAASLAFLVPCIHVGKWM